MIQKILTSIVLFVGIFFFSQNTYAEGFPISSNLTINSLYFIPEVSASGCTYRAGQGPSEFLEGCVPNTTVSGTGETMKVTDGLKEKINGWIKNVSVVLGIIAVASLVYAGMLMQFSAGEDDKVNKAKKIIRWTLIGFLCLIGAGALIYIVIQVIFQLGE